MFIKVATTQQRRRLVVPRVHKSRSRRLIAAGHHHARELINFVNSLGLGGGPGSIQQNHWDQALESSIEINHRVPHSLYAEAFCLLPASSSFMRNHGSMATPAKHCST